MKNLLNAGCAVLLSVITLSNAMAGTSTIRELELKGNNTEILLDSVIDKNSINIEYIRDIVQFSISNATIYPAKMMHADQAAFSKVFAYQYSPELVRIRFSVDQNAEQFRNKVKWAVDGKKVSIQFSAPVVAVTPKIDHEKTLLQKITGTTSVTGTSEKIELKKTESQPLALGGTGKTPIKLAGAKSGPSAFRSFLAMFLIVGGLGLVLIYVKRKKSLGIQAKKSGNSWFSNLLPNAKNQKPLMEVIATHVLGPKQSIVVMKIRGQQFVLAVTAENIQLITQLDSDESELDLLDDPKVAASIGKMFGVSSAKKAPIIPTVSPDVNFNLLLKNSDGAGAIIARNAYENNSAPVVKTGIATGGARDMIRKRLEGMQ